jgi:hypothetical protein
MVTASTLTNLHVTHVMHPGMQAPNRAVASGIPPKHGSCVGPECADHDAERASGRPVDHAMIDRLRDDLRAVHGGTAVH